MDVGVWLGNLGLGQYEAAFRDNEIDGAVLPKLTLDDLKDLGVAVVGHRRKIVVRASSGGRRGGARALTTLVGREDELALLMRRWARTLEGEGHGHWERQ